MNKYSIVKNGSLIRYDMQSSPDGVVFNLDDIVRELIMDVIKERKIIFPKQKEETSEEYDATCLNFMHKAQEEISSLALSRFMKNEGFDIVQDELGEYFEKVTLNILSNMSTTQKED